MSARTTALVSSEPDATAREAPASDAGADSELTTFEAEIVAELRDGKACTRTRFKIIRDAYQRIKKKNAK